MREQFRRRCRGQRSSRREGPGGRWSAENGLRTHSHEAEELSSSRFQPASLTSSVHRAEPAVSAKSALEQSVPRQPASRFTTGRVSREKTKIYTERSSDKRTAACGERRRYASSAKLCGEDKTSDGRPANSGPISPRLHPSPTHRGPEC